VTDTPAPANAAAPASAPRADIGVIGGSGLYALLDPATSTSHRIETPFGPTSSEVTVGELAGRRVAFLTRHGADHSVAPHLIDYRANVWALASLGVTAIVSSSAVGGVSPDYPPGSLVLTDQLLDRTWGRPDTFFDAGVVQHLSAADPFDPELHARAAAALVELEGGDRADPAGPLRTSGTVVVIQGPRFSTRAESLWFRQAGAHIVNMTQYPEVVLASELNIGTVNLSFVTDADAGLAPLPGEQGDAVTAELVFARLREAQPRIVRAIEAVIRAIPSDYRGRPLIDRDAVASVLARPVAGATFADGARS